MITKEKALEKALKVLKDKKIEYSSIDNINKITFTSKDEMKRPFPHGKHKGIKKDHFTISYGEIWGIEERSMFLDIDADTGEALLITTPHGYIDVEE